MRLPEKVRKLAKAGSLRLFGKENMTQYVIFLINKEELKKE